MAARRRKARAERAEPAQWVQNPTVVITQQPVAHFRVRGFGQKDVHDPVLVDALLRGGTTHSDVVQALIREGLFVRPTDVPQPVRFHCPLSFDLPPLFPLSARPERSSRQKASADETFGLNPKLQWQRSARVPPQIRARVNKAVILAAPPMLWVEDPATQMVFPYWPDAAVRECLAQLAQGRITAEALTTGQRFVLASARILVPRAEIDQPGSTFLREGDALAQQLADDQYVVLRDLFPPYLVAHLRGYFRALENEGYLSRGDTQVARRHSLYREPLSDSWHAQLAPLLGLATREALRASYSFFGVYLPDAVLERHKDRPQCRWNLSVIWDTRPERGRADAWPIYLEVEGRARRANLGMGDGLLYRGTELFHWRKPQPKSSFTTATFFHFVDRTFSGSLD